MISAVTWNAIMDAVQYVRDHQGHIGGAPGGTPREAGIVYISAAEAITPLAPVEFTNAVFPATDAAFKFLRPTFQVRVPTGEDPHARFAIALEPNPGDGQTLTKAMVTGVVACEVTIAAATDTYAVLPKSTTEATADAGLYSAAAGNAAILWKAGDSGKQWCLLQLGTGGGETYNGYFKLIAGTAENTVAVIDGANPDATFCGLAYFNLNPYYLNKASGLAVTPNATTYIWLKCDTSADPVAPVIEAGTALPVSDYNLAVVLLGRVVAGQIIQEHHGAVYAVVFTDECEVTA